MNVASLLLCALFATQTAEPEIVGPERIEAGRLAVFTVESQPDAKALWKVFAPDRCTLLESDIAAYFENNHAMAFASPIPGKYRIVVAVATSSELWLLDRELFVEGTPPPGPDPGPGPTPPGPGPSPPGQWARWAYEKSRELIPDSFRLVEADKVADALRIVCESIAAGRITDSRRAREQVRMAVRESLGTLEAVNRWQPFSNALDAELDKITSELVKPSDYAAIWREVAEGLVWRPTNE